TAKDTRRERRGLPPPLLDPPEAAEEASASAYPRAARRAVAEVRPRRRGPRRAGRPAASVPGALRGVEFPPTDPAVRARLEERAAQVGAEALHRELADSDPEAAAGIGSGDTRRIVRALEVGELTGRPFTAFLPRPHLHDPSTVQL